MPFYYLSWKCDGRWKLGRTSNSEDEGEYVHFVFTYAFIYRYPRRIFNMAQKKFSMWLKPVAFARMAGYGFKDLHLEEVSVKLSMFL